MKTNGEKTNRECKAEAEFKEDPADEEEEETLEDEKDSITYKNRCGGKTNRKKEKEKEKFNEK